MLKSLLGFLQPQPDPYQTLLGEYYDPQTARMKWLGGTLQGLGLGLASGSPGGWAEGMLSGGDTAVDDYRQQAIFNYGLNERAQEAERRRQEEADQAAALEMFPPEMQPIVKAYPQIGQEYLRRQYLPDQPSSADRYKVVGNNMYDTQTGQWLSSPNGSQPDLPKGYRWKQDGSGAEPIPGVVVPGQPKQYSLTTGDRTAIRNAAEENVVLEQTLKNLDEAKSIVGDTNQGWLATGRASVAENLPDKLVPDMIFGSPKQGEATNRFKQIMDAEALASMGKLLKGPTSDRDVSLMLQTVNDPNAPTRRKRAAIDRVRSLIDAQIAQNEEMISGLKDGSFYGGAGGGQNGAIVTPDGFTVERVE